MEHTQSSNPLPCTQWPWCQLWNTSCEQTIWILCCVSTGAVWRHQWMFFHRKRWRHGSRTDVLTSETCIQSVMTSHLGITSRKLKKDLLRRNINWSSTSGIWRSRFWTKTRRKSKVEKRNDRRPRKEQKRTIQGALQLAILFTNRSCTLS